MAEISSKAEPAAKPNCLREPTSRIEFAKRKYIWLLVAVHTSLLVYSSVVHSPNLNEPAHLAAGLSHFKFGNFSLYPVNPPFIKCLAALPACVLGYEEDWSSVGVRGGVRPEFYVGADFIRANGMRSFWLVTFGRWACIPVAVTGLLCCYFWARALYGTAAGNLSATLWCFSPTMIAHGSFLSPDGHAASLGLLAGFTFWRWLKFARWRDGLLAGLGLGLALIAKFTWVLLIPIWLTVVCGMRLTSRSEDTKPHWGQLLAIILMGIYIVNVSYGFNKTMTPLNVYHFSSNAFQTLSLQSTEKSPLTQIIRAVPVPVPKPYLVGMDLQKVDLEQSRTTYVNGENYSKGFWYYYVYAMAIKMPLATQAMIILAMLTAWKRRFAWAEAVLIIVPFTVIAAVSLHTNWNAHLRYVIGAFPFLFVLAGRLFSAETAKSHIGQTLMMLGISWLIGSSLLCFPHSMGYFNEAVGGYQNGYRYLRNSNCDWGQDLFFLKKWLDDHPEAEPIQLAYFGGFDPSVAEISYRNHLAVLNAEFESNECQVKGTVIVSVNFVTGNEVSPMA